MDIVMQYGADNPILRKKSEYISNINKDIRDLAKRMEIEVKAQDGMWIAAPQLWYNIRMAVITSWDIIKGKYIYKSSRVIINPEIIKHSDSVSDDWEGCLSLPGDVWLISRYDWIEIAYQDMYGKSKTAKLKWIDARIAQHEIDHLDGVLYIDRAKIIKPDKM